ncbi:MAG TPA: transcription antitermination factor NusB [Mycobacteriales bacterium]
MKPSARRVALDLLVQVDVHGAYANLALPRLLEHSGLSLRDRAFATELGYGTLRALGSLDHLVGLDASRPVGEVEPEVRAALRLGAYQLWRLRTPAHAAVGEAVGLVPERARGFVNAVLRQTATRCKSADPLALQGLPALDALALDSAHPQWVVELYREALGSDDELRAALDADNVSPPVHLVALPHRMSADELAVESGGGRGRWSPYCVVLPGGDPATLQSVRRGAARVQDEGSQLAALALERALPPDPHPSRFADVPGGPVDDVTAQSLMRHVQVLERLVDLCAGPGGKAALLGALGDSRRQVVAMELRPHRARLVRNSGVDAVVVADGRVPPLPPGCADGVLLDAPCSGLGALRRRPESRWRRTPDDLPGLVARQRELLASAWTLLEPGGVLAYVVCSPVLAEAVIDVPEDGELLDAPGLLGLPDHARAPENPRRMQLWPHRHGTDAMSTVLLRKH